MINNKGGSIINLGSVSWVRGAVMFPAYSTAKAAIHGLTRSLANDLGKNNIRINSIAPGSIATERQSKLWLNPKFKKEILKNQALKKTAFTRRCFKNGSVLSIRCFIRFYKTKFYS